mmetsp:Transcript_17029/g.54645  ORF Transcript_17029/g.54645 Transcript_17029/m.54645 type:complete len:222 (+) Transcript_17029:559-1224(+)
MTLRRGAPRRCTRPCSKRLCPFCPHPPQTHPTPESLMQTGAPHPCPRWRASASASGCCARCPPRPSPARSQSTTCRLATASALRSWPLCGPKWTAASHRASCAPPSRGRGGCPACLCASCWDRSACAARLTCWRSTWAALRATCGRRRRRGRSRDPARPGGSCVRTWCWRGGRRASPQRRTRQCTGSWRIWSARCARPGCACCGSAGTHCGGSRGGLGMSP